jgi:hypothetical protein
MSGRGESGLAASLEKFACNTGKSVMRWKELDDKS